MSGLERQYACDMFTSNSHSYNTRNASQPIPPKARTAYYQRSFNVSGMKLWNSIPQDIQTSQSFASFKKSLLETRPCHAHALGFAQASSKMPHRFQDPTFHFQMPSRTRTSILICTSLSLLPDSLSTIIRQATH